MRCAAHTPRYAFKCAHARGRCMADDAPTPEGWRPEWKRRDAKPERLKAPVVAIGECPDPNGADAARLLHAAAYRRLWALLAAEGTTPQDVIASYAATRIAARVGADRAPVKAARLRMKSILPSASDARDPE